MEQTYRWVVSPLVSSLPTWFFPLQVKVKSELVYQFRYCHTLRSDHRPRWFHRHSVGVRSDFSQDPVITAVDQSTRSHSKLLRWCCAAWVWSPPVFLLMYWHACRGPGGMPGGGLSCYFHNRWEHQFLEYSSLYLPLLDDTVPWLAAPWLITPWLATPWLMTPWLAAPWWHSSLISCPVTTRSLVDNIFCLTICCTFSNCALKSQMLSSHYFIVIAIVW